MYSVDRTSYGIRIDLDDTVSPEEMREFNEEVRRVVDSLEAGFGVVADLRGLDALSDEASELLADAMAHSKRREFGRAAVAVDSPILGLQQEQLGEDVGVSSSGRVVLDATEVDDWEQQALDWVKHGEEPDV